MKFYLLFIILFSSIENVLSLGRRVQKTNYSKYINRDRQEVTIKYYYSLNSCYKNNYLHYEKELYYYDCNCFKKYEDCKYKLIDSDDFINYNRSLTNNLSYCLNNYHSKNHDIFDKCLYCDSYFINLDIEVKNLICVTLFSFLTLLAVILFLFIIFYILKRLNRNKKKKYILIKNNRVNN